MEAVLAIIVGIGLAAACGFRVFIPPLVMAIGVRTGHIQVAQSFQWVGSDIALVMLITATAAEIAAYYVPWLDNLLDTIATPAAAVAGTLVTASVISGMSPMLTWSIALIAGGGAATAVQVSTVALRGASTLTTGGIANPVVATAELAAASAVSIFIMLLPVIFAVLAVFALGWALFRFVARRRAAAAAASRVVVQVTPVSVKALPQPTPHATRVTTPAAAENAYLTHV